MSVSLGIGIAAGLVLLVMVAIVISLRRRDRDGGVSRALTAISVSSLKDVLVPDGMDGAIHVEHLLLTARGIVVVNVKPYRGIVFASDRMDDWTVMRDGVRSTISNPVGPLYDRVAAVKQVVKDVDVHGYVVFPEGADFSKGQPGSVMLPGELLAAFPKPEGGDRDRVLLAFKPFWERLKAALLSEADPV